MRDYVICGKCGYRYDPVEVRGGICDDCREEQERQEKAGEAFACLSEEADGQMTFLRMTARYALRMDGQNGAQKKAAHGRAAGME